MAIATGETIRVDSLFASRKLMGQSVRDLEKVVSEAVPPGTTSDKVFEARTTEFGHTPIVGSSEWAQRKLAHPLLAILSVKWLSEEFNFQTREERGALDEFVRRATISGAEYRLDAEGDRYTVGFLFEGAVNAHFQSDRNLTIEKIHEIIGEPEQIDVGNWQLADYGPFWLPYLSVPTEEEDSLYQASEITDALSSACSGLRVNFFNVKTRVLPATVAPPDFYTM